ncbi:hypothetical protein RFI_21636, partial [Reticulomyxa filosa]
IQYLAAVKTFTLFLYLALVRPCLACVDSQKIFIVNMFIYFKKEIHLIEKYIDIITHLEFSLDGSEIISCSDDVIIRIWDILSGKQIQSLQGHMVIKLHLIQILKKIQLWNVLTGKQIRELEGHSDNNIKGIKFSPDSSKIISYSDDKTIQIWDISSGK